MSQPAEVARIADLTYRNYDGPLRTRAIRWWAVSLAVLRTNLRKPGFWILAAMVFLIFLFHGGAAYFLKNATLMSGGRMMGQSIVFKGHNSLYADSLASALWYLNLFPLFLVALVVGSGSIAADNRANALLVYLSKPITKTDYLIGKWVGLFLLIGAISLLPSLLLYLFFWTTYSSDGFLRDNPTLLLRIFPATLIPAAIHASLILGFSSWSRSPGMAGASYAGFFTVTGAITASLGLSMFHQVLLNEDLGKAGRVENAQAVTRNCLSIAGVSNGLGCLIYDVDPNYIDAIRHREYRRRAQQPDALTLVLVAGALVVLPIGAAYTRVRAVEVVRG